MLSDEFMNCVAFDENSISDFSRRILDMKSDRMKSGDVFPRRSKKLKDIDDCNVENEDIKIIDLDPPFIKETEFVQEGKQDPMLGLLDWLKGIARNPCDPSICSLPEKSKWKSYGNEEIWKQVLMVREEMFVKRQVDSSSEQSFVQRNQRMHPCMYDDDTVPIYNLRKRLSFDKKDLSQEPVSKPSDSSPTDSSDDYKSVPLGSDYQAQVPKWNGEIPESDLKWLGTQEWPLKKGRNRYLVERDPIGKGRRDPCGCSDPNSVGCVKFHVTEKRHRLKLELSDAFFQWRFDNMGEDVAFGWTVEEEKKFEDIVLSNPPSLGISYWEDIIESFPSRSKADLVNYYYNVFLLRRRGHQNRVTPDEIDSDEESESGVATNGFVNVVHNSPGSIFYSPKKPR